MKVRMPFSRTNGIALLAALSALTPALDWLF